MWKNDRYNCSTTSRATERCREGEYMMVSADGGREIVLASSNHTGFLLKITQMPGICWRGVKKCATFEI